MTATSGLSITLNNGSRVQAPITIWVLAMLQTLDEVALTNVCAAVEEIGKKSTGLVVPNTNGGGLILPS